MEIDGAPQASGLVARSLPVRAFDDQRPGTSGLRKTTRQFREPGYLEAFVQSIFEACGPIKTLVVGGDGRFFADEAVQIILRIAAGNGCEKIIVGQDGLLSTPAASHLIRSRSADGGILLSASHNPGGPDGDFGVKFNTATGAPAPEQVTEAIFAASRTINRYKAVHAPDIGLSRPGHRRVGAAQVEVVDAAAEYADLMERLFDLERIRSLLGQRDFRMLFDAMHAVTGPFAEEIFHRRLGLSTAALLRREPLPDFGGGHPDPSPQNAGRLMSLMREVDGPDFGAASDGDGDRHMIVGAGGFWVNPSDSLAILTANSGLVPGYAGRVAGVARSMPTSQAVDAVAAALGIPCFETPTGWKYFGSLLDDGRITLCGEESAGAGSDHVREKDGVWAVLFWLNILAATGLSVRETVGAHWARFGRHAAARLDFENIPAAAANDLLEVLRRRLPELSGQSSCERKIERADEFSYADPVSGLVAEQQGVRLFVAGGGRIVMRLSGTGTQGATLRLYLEQYIQEPTLLERSADDLTRDLERIATEVASIPYFTGLSAPTHRT